MKTFVMSNIVIPKGISLCIQGECPKSSECVRHILYENNSHDMPRITILNPKVTPFTDKGCPYFCEYKLTRYACGFRKLYNTIPVQHADKFWTTIPGITSESMYYRMKRGDKLIPPALQQNILASARKCGAPETVDFDEYRDVVEVQSIE